MKKTLIGLAVVGILFFSSCITSLHPLYTADTEIFDTSLIGRWEEDNETMLFEKAPKGDYYKLTYRSEDEPPAEIEVHLVKLGAYYYLDFRAWKELGREYDYNVLAPRIDVHNFARVIWDEKQLKLILFDGEKIEKLLEQRRARIKHEKMNGDQFVLTAQPEELQQFILKYSDELLDFSSPLVLPKVG